MTIFRTKSNALMKTRRPRKLTVLTVSAVAVLAASVGIAQATGTGIFHGKAISYPARHYAAAPLELAVFSRPATPREVSAARDPAISNSIRLLTASDTSIPAEWLPGDARLQDLRLPLEDLGPAKRSIFLVRTTKARICAGLTGFSSGCLAGLPPDVPLTVVSADPDVSGEGEPALAWGVARNNVQRVDIVVTGRPEPATLAGNVYFFQLTNPSLPAEAIESAVAHLTGGRSVTIPALHGPPSTRAEHVIRAGPKAP